MYFEDFNERPVPSCDKSHCAVITAALLKFRVQSRSERVPKRTSRLCCAQIKSLSTNQGLNSIPNIKLVIIKTLRVCDFFLIVKEKLQNFSWNFFRKLS